MAITFSTSTTLTNAQRNVLTDAAQRADACGLLPARLKGGAPRKLAQALLDKGLVREGRAKGEQPVWRTDADTGRSYALVLTKAGRAVGAWPAHDEPQPASGVAGDAAPAPASKPANAADHTAASSLDAPRAGSKLANVIALLDRAQGSSVPELMAATGWLPHTTRAALTGLRKRGYALTRAAGEGGPVYRIGASPTSAAAAAA